MVDNVNYIGFDPAKPHGRGKYEGRIDQRQLDFFANVLKEYPTDKLVVTCMHIPLQNYLFSDDPSMNTINCRDFLKLISGRPNTISLSGHTHTTEHHYFGAEDGFVGPSLHHHHVMTAVSGSWWSGPYDHRGIAVADSRDGSPNGYHVLSIDGQSYSTQFQPANEANSRQMRIVLDSDFPPRQQGALPRIPHGRAARIAYSIGQSICDEPYCKFLRWRSPNIGRISRRPARSRKDGAGHAVRSICRGGFRPQRGNEKALG
jgi:3',5'-cyclic AMP phosphodiesterase CpdA